ncbi:phosphoglucosamine mutase [Ferrimonas sediminicola]|uniref:Phosphoglucosamine mutase n=1 Tax=Ferrimonas sediminicola TaxID=2569538 RepID=A0A4U1B8Y2_9GAMM|nr:phosphoglucosamine mutase [Ferrimonas sediminicola]TKB46477.1 phosphoglucosamine mutase [Ferrimonas sediminicola]
MSRKYFGTDGVRGLVGKYPITPDFAMKLGWAAGKVLASKGNNRVLIGKDTRISGYMLESAMEAGFVAAGIDVAFLGPMPTPAVAYLTRTFRGEAGVVISASHNPYHDNGIKFFSADGTKLNDDIELEIESWLDREMDCVPSERLGKASRIADAAGRYIEYCKATFCREFSLRGQRIVLDCAHGATYHVAPPVFTELGAEVITICNTPNGTNINDQCGATHLAALRKKVVEVRADFGIAFDGDGDRVMMVDADGSVIDGDVILYILASHWKRKGIAFGGVVGTQMANMGLELALAEMNIPFARSKVGDRYVVEMLKEKGWSLGGENSGHILALEHASTGDGIIAALQVLQVLAETGQTLSKARAGMTLLPQVLVNVKFSGQSAPLEAQAVQQAVADAEASLAGRGRVLLRKSGTEPLIRVMVEGEDQAQVDHLAHAIADVIRAEGS